MSPLIWCSKFTLAATKTPLTFFEVGFVSFLVNERERRKLDGSANAVLKRLKKKKL